MINKRYFPSQFSCEGFLLLRKIVNVIIKIKEGFL